MTAEVRQVPTSLAVAAGCLHEAVSAGVCLSVCLSSCAQLQLACDRAAGQTPTLVISESCWVRAAGITVVQASGTSASSSVAVDDVDRRLLLHSVLLSIDKGPATLCRRLHASTPLLTLLTEAVSTAVSAFSSAADAATAADASAALPAPPLWLQPAFAVLAHFASVHPVEPAFVADGGMPAGNATEKAEDESMEGAQAASGSAGGAAACAAAVLEEEGGAGGEEAEAAAASTSSAGALLHISRVHPNTDLFIRTV
jgi:hypothetical protein